MVSYKDMMEDPQSAAQLRHLEMLKLVREDFKGQDQYVMVMPLVGPHAIKILECTHAAEFIVDKKARLATDEEIEKYKLENEMARQKNQKEIDRHDLAKSFSRVMKD